MRNFLAILAGVIPLIGVVPYLLDSAKGKTKPNIVTWFTWTLINGINGAAALGDGAVQTAIFSGFAFVATASIVVVGLRHGLRKYTAFDITCQIVALLGIPLWLMTDEPALAVALILLVDFAGGLPTLRHAWRAPHEETLATFALSAVGSGLLVASLTRFDFVALAMPLYIFMFDTTILTTLLTRRRRLAKEVRAT